MIVQKIDIHAHNVFQHEYAGMGDGRYYPTTVEEIRKMYDAVGVEKGVQLPLVSPEHHNDLLTNREARLLVEKHPETVGWWFCNVDPRWLKNTADADLSIVMEYYKSLGAKGIGELTANIYIDDPMMQNLFYHAEKCGLPILFHIGKAGGDDYGIVDDLGLPRLEESLKKFPKLIFIGHSHKWWSEISGDCSNETRGSNPKGPVVPGGRVVELMRKYPNMYGDLSAGSGENAIMRDPEFGYKFLEEFQDKLFFGLDYCNVSNYRYLSNFLDEAVESGKISQIAYNKICRENALKLLEG